MFFISFFVFLVGEIGILAVSEYGRMGEISKVTHPSVDNLVVRGLVRDDEGWVNGRGNDSMINAMIYGID